MTKFTNATINAAATVNVTADQLKAIASKFTWKKDDGSAMTPTAVNRSIRSHVVAEFAAAPGVEELPTLGHRGARSSAAYSEVAGGKDVAVFVGKRTIVATGVLHADGSITSNGTTYGSPSRALVEVYMARGKAAPRVSGWVKWLYIDANGNVRPIEALRQGGVEQKRSRTSIVRRIESKGDVRTFKAIARREAKGTKVTAPGAWTE